MEQTKQQKRAQFALEQLKNLIEKDAITKEIANYIVGMPNMILSNGLGQSLIFLKSKSQKKDDEKYGLVYDVLKKYIRKEYSKYFDSDDEKLFLNKLNTIDQFDYVTIQNECLRMLEWLKRYARAFQQKENS